MSKYDMDIPIHDVATTELRSPLKQVADHVNKSNILHGLGLVYHGDGHGSTVWSTGNCLVVARAIDAQLTELCLSPFQLCPPNSDASTAWSALDGSLPQTWIVPGKRNKQDESAWLNEELLQWAVDGAVDMAASIDEAKYKAKKRNEYSVGLSPTMSADVIEAQVREDWQQYREMVVSAQAQRARREAAAKLTAQQAAEDYFALLATTSPSGNAANDRPGCILIVTVTKVEAEAVFEVFSQRPEPEIGPCNIYYNLGTHGGAPIFMVQSEMGTGTHGGSLQTVQQAIEDKHPQTIIMCGIAFGLHPDKQELGDILVATQIQSYEPGKVDTQQGQIPRAGCIPVTGHLLKRFRAADLSRPGLRTCFGLVLSGEKLVKKATFRDQLKTTWPEAIGGDMEGAGLCLAAYDAKVDWALIKAISDWADGNKNDDAQPQAARNAAEFVLHVLQMGGWDKSLAP